MACFYYSRLLSLCSWPVHLAWRESGRESLVFLRICKSFSCRQSLLAFAAPASGEASAPALPAVAVVGAFRFHAHRSAMCITDPSILLVKHIYMLTASQQCERGKSGIAAARSFCSRVTLDLHHSIINQSTRPWAQAATLPSAVQRQSGTGMHFSVTCWSSALASPSWPPC